MERNILNTIFDFMINDAFDDFRRVNRTINHFKSFIYDEKGNYKDKNSSFITDFICTIDKILNSFGNSKIINFELLRIHLIDLALLKNESEA